MYKVKNDRVDAYRIAMLYRLKVLRPSQIPTSTLRVLRLLTRQRSELMDDVARFKNRLTAYLDQIFPGYCEVFSDVGGVSSRAVLRRWPAPDMLLAVSMDEIAEFIGKAGNKGRMNMLDIIEVTLEAIRRVEGEIKALVKQEPSFDENEKLLCSIPGIGFSSAVVIVAEMWYISLFREPKQLAAYFGLDPGERQYGTLKRRKNRLYKQGSPQVRAVPHIVVVSSVSRNRGGTYKNSVLAEYYEKK